MFSAAPFPSTASRRPSSASCRPWFHFPAGGELPTGFGYAPMPEVWSLDRADAGTAAEPRRQELLARRPAAKRREPAGRGSRSRGHCRGHRAPVSRLERRMDGPRDSAARATRRQRADGARRAPDGGRPRAAHRLRERRQSAARPRGVAAAGGRRALRARGRALADPQAAAGREPDAVARGRCARHPDRMVGASGAADHAAGGHARGVRRRPRRARRRVHGSHVDSDRPRLRPRARGPDRASGPHRRPSRGRARLDWQPPRPSDAQRARRRRSRARGDAAHPGVAA